MKCNISRFSPRVVLLPGDTWPYLGISVVVPTGGALGVECLGARNAAQPSMVFRTAPHRVTQFQFQLCQGGGGALG